MTHLIQNLRSQPTIHCRDNEKYLLHILRLRKRESKANLARETGLTAAAVGGIISSLLDKGLVENVGKVQGDMGQPATLFSLSREGAYSFGVNIHQDVIQTSLINFVGEVVANKKYEAMLPSPNKALDLILSDIQDMLYPLDAEATQRIAGIGITQSDTLKTENTAWASWGANDLADELNKRAGLDTLTKNDINAAATAELIYGVGAHLESFIYLFFGPAMAPNLSGAVVLNGECRNGATGSAGNIGMIPLPAGTQLNSTDGTQQKTNNLSHRASLYALVDYLRAQGVDITSRQDLDHCMNTHHQAINEWVIDAVSALKDAIYTFQSLIDAQAIIIDCQDIDAPLIDRIIHEFTRTPSQTKPHNFRMPQIRKGTFGSNAAAIGAATLPLDATFSLRLNRQH